MMTMTCLMGDLVLSSFLPGPLVAGAVTAEAVCAVTSERGSPGLLGAELQAADAPSIDVANNPNVVCVRIFRTLLRLKEVVPAAPYAAIVPAERASPATWSPLAGPRIS